MKEQRVEAVERALSILEAFTEDRRSLTLAELSRETGLYKSTILRLAGSLILYGYLRRSEDGHYRVGPSLWRLGSIFRRSFELGEHIRPELRWLVEKTGETASFYVREEDERICLYRENSKQALRYHLDEGSRLPANRGAAAHVLRAFSSDARPEDSRIREAGYSISVAERSPGVAAVAVPVLDSDGNLRGSLAVSGPLPRFDEPNQREAAAHLSEAAGRLTKALTGDLGRFEIRKRLGAGATD